MSDAVSYVSEPNTVGKVVVVTTLGEMDIELFSRECPLACRNFIQLCLEGYYNGCIFHRIIKNFMAQTGDPTGTGFGGDSIYGDPFKDEFHGRLKFNRRGLIGMASSGKDANTSQWFITLGKAEWLDKKHTLFGKITGDTIYNAIKLNDVDVGTDDRPNAPPKIIRTEVISNPYTDIQPRMKVASQSDKQDKVKVKGTKNLSLLSFADDEQLHDEDADSNIAIVAKSVHDVDDTGHFSSKTVEQQLAEARETEQKQREQEAAAKREATRDALRAKSKPVPEERKRSRSSSSDSTSSRDSHSDSKQRNHTDSHTRDVAPEVSTDHMDDAQFDAFMKQKLIAAKGGNSKAAAQSTSSTSSTVQSSTSTSMSAPSASAEYLSLVKSLKSKHSTASDKRSHALKVEEATRVDASEESLYTSSAANRLKYIARKRNKQLKRREDDTLAKLAAFTNTIRNVSSSSNGSQQGNTIDEVNNSAASSNDGVSDDDADNDRGWLSHSIKFAKRPQDFIGSSRDAQGPSHAASNDFTSDYAIIDPKGMESSITSMDDFEKLKTSQWKQLHMRHQQAMEKQRSQNTRHERVEDISDHLMKLTEHSSSSQHTRNSRSSRSHSPSSRYFRHKSVRDRSHDRERSRDRRSSRDRYRQRSRSRSGSKARRRQSRSRSR